MNGDATNTECSLFGKTRFTALVAGPDCDGRSKGILCEVKESSEFGLLV
jgi:hypothetical protein